jgi:hypothetical protein
MSMAELIIGASGEANEPPEWRYGMAVMDAQVGQHVDASSARLDGLEGVERPGDVHEECHACPQIGLAKDDPFYVPEPEDHDPAHLEEVQRSVTRWQNEPRWDLITVMGARCFCKDI